MGPGDSETHSLPHPDLLAQQAAWLAPARGRLLRRTQIARRRSVLDLGCGWQIVTRELSRRSAGRVVAADLSRRVLTVPPEDRSSVWRVNCDGARLPFRPGSFDLVFCQFALLWLDATGAIGEIRRVLAPGGVLVAIEPDYGGLIEFPGEIATAGLWEAALTRAGADPRIGRRLPGLLAERGFQVRVDLFDRLSPTSPLRFELLRGLPLTEEEERQLDAIVAADRRCKASHRVVHLPVFLVTASTPGVS